MPADKTARNVAERVDALAAALRAAGVPPEQSAGLLAAAATAAMNAVMLDAVLEEINASTHVGIAEVGPVAQPVRLAA
jgi:non-ribosomal peptide synthetase component F